MFPLYKFLETEAKEHDSDWFNDCCRYVRLYMQPLISKQDAKTGMDYILGRQSLEYVERKFINTSKLNLTDKNYVNYRGQVLDRFGVPATQREGNKAKDFLNKGMEDTPFLPLPVMEKIKNILINDLGKAGVIVNVRAEDPTSKAKRQIDREIIENRKKIERDLSYLYTSIGDKPYVMADHEKRFGDKVGNGNMQLMDEMGMDSGDPADVSFIFDHFYKLDSEIEVQKVIDALISYNHLGEKGEMWGLDMMAKKCVAAKNYVSKLTGEILSEYVAPETAFTFGGTRRSKDFNDSLAKAIEQSMTLKQAIEICGDSFDIEKEFNRILSTYQIANNIEFTGIEKGWQGFVDNGMKMTTKGGTGAGGSGSVGWDTILSMNVSMGYMEISSQIQIDKTPVKGENGKYYEDNQPPTKKRYQNKARYECPFYCASYLALSQIDQIIFDFGMVPYQQIEGYNDVHNAFTIVTFKETGDPIGKTCIPYVDLINECWYKGKHELDRAKASGTDYNYEALLAVSQSLIPDDSITTYDKVVMVMQMLDASSNSMYTWPIGPDGKPVIMTSGQLHVPRINGIGENVLLWFRIISDQEKELMDKLGISQLRQADPGNTKDSVSNQFKALEYSFASTAYIPDTVTKLYRSVSIRNMLYVQDIVTYKEYDTMTYSWLANLVGEEALDKIAALGKRALHRYGIFVESVNQAPFKAKLDLILANDQNTNKISTGEALIINDIKSPKEAWRMLAFFEQRNKKMAQKDAMQQQQSKQDHEKEIQMIAFNTEKMKQDNLRMIAAMGNSADLQGKGIMTQSSLAKQEMKQNADSKQIYEQTHADMLKSIHDSLIAMQQMAGAPPPPPVQQPNNIGQAPPQQPGQPQTGLGQLRQNAGQPGMQ